MDGNVDLSVIMVSYNTADLLPQAMAALRRAAAGLRLQTIIVDNASRDRSPELLRRDFADCELILNKKNVGFGRANNQALPLVRGRHVLLLNTDAFVAPDTLEKSLAYLDAHPRCGVLGVRLLGRNREPQPSARRFPTPWRLFLQRTGLERFLPRRPDDSAPDPAAPACDWVPGCYYLVRRQVIDEIGLFDPRYFLYYEEVDHCRAAHRAGWEVACLPDTAVVHIGGESARSDGEVTPAGRQIEALQMESELLYFRKNHGLPTALADVALTLAGDAILAAKRLLLGRRPFALAAYWRHARQMCSLFARTHGGAQPTHQP